MNIIHFLYLLDYFFLAGQAAFYLLCFQKVFSVIPAEQFIGIRKLADPILELRLSILYYGGLVLGLVFVIMSIANGNSYPTLAAGASLLLLVADVVLAKRYNIPINAAIRNTVVIENSSASLLQQTWLRWIGIRGMIIVAGFIILLLSAVL